MMMRIQRVDLERVERLLPNCEVGFFRSYVGLSCAALRCSWSPVANSKPRGLTEYVSRNFGFAPDLLSPELLKPPKS